MKLEWKEVFAGQRPNGDHKFRLTQESKEYVGRFECLLYTFNDNSTINYITIYEDFGLEGNDRFGINLSCRNLEKLKEGAAKIMETILEMENV
jgi:hypothetical protein